MIGCEIGRIEAATMMLGQTMTMVSLDVVGFKLSGKLRDVITITDLVFTVMQILRDVITTTDLVFIVMQIDLRIAF